MGYYPIVITRKWEKDIETIADVNQTSSPNITVEKFDFGEVHYLPYLGNIRDNIISKRGFNKWLFIRKLLSFVELFFENLSQSFIPYRSFYSHALSLVQKDKIVGAVISGGPFPQFLFGYLLRKKIHLPWIADYRDDWSTDKVRVKGGPFFRFLKKMNTRSEKKWVGSAAAFTTISPFYKEKIAALVKIPGHVLQNGFSKTDICPANGNISHTLVYNGTLYPTQPVEILIRDLAVYNSKNDPHLQIEFPGLGIDSVQLERVTHCSKKYNMDAFIHASPRIPLNDVIEKQKNSLALIMLGHTGLKGIPSSKIYEYLSLGKPIILFEPDGDILEQIVSGYNLGFIVGKPFSFEEIIHKIYSTDNVPDAGYIENFSREGQVKMLATLMDTYF